MMVLFFSLVVPFFSYKAIKQALFVINRFDKLTARENFQIKREKEKLIFNKAGTGKSLSPFFIYMAACPPGFPVDSGCFLGIIAPLRVFVHQRLILI
jgi:hypothetical protein